jgi:hypothetical protein
VVGVREVAAVVRILEEGSSARPGGLAAAAVAEALEYRSRHILDDSGQTTIALEAGTLAP